MLSMTRLLAVALLFALADLAPAEDKKLKDAIVDIANDKDDKIETKVGSATEPTAIRDEESLKKAIPDEATRKRIAKLVDFKEQKLLIFAWQGSEIGRASCRERGESVDGGWSV